MSHLFRVHIGYTRSGRDRWRKFVTLTEASAFCNRVFHLKGVVLSITKAS
jgi:hypothetical protein